MYRMSLAIDMASSTDISFTEAKTFPSLVVAFTEVSLSFMFVSLYLALSGTSSVFTWMIL